MNGRSILAVTSIMDPLMSGRNIVLFQELRDALAGQSQTAGVLGPDKRELDPLLPDWLCLGAAPEETITSVPSGNGSSPSSTTTPL